MLTTFPAIGSVAAQVETVQVRQYERVLVILFLMTLPLVNPWVRGDGVGYYAYVRSLLTAHNLDFQKDWLAANPSFTLSRIDAQGHLLPQMYTRTGHIDNHFTIGPAILWSPVFGAVHLGVLTARRVGVAVNADGYSRPYVFATALATAVYGFIALLLSFRVARKYFEPRWALLAVLSIWFASSLPVYMYFNPFWSHAHSAFAVALFVWYWDRTRGVRTLWPWVVLGCIAGLMGNIYYPNILLLIFPATEIGFMVLRREHDAPAVRVRELGRNLIAFAAACGITLLPSLITRKIIYGNAFATGYPGIATWNWFSPALLKVLFSSDHGLWTWTPILFFAVLGLLFLIRRDRVLGLGALLAVVVYCYFIASYPDWDGLSSYGNRFFVSLTPIFILGLAALLSAFAQWMALPRRAPVFAGAALAAFILWNVALMFQWGTHLVPARGEISLSEMAQNQFTAVPMRFTQTLESYFLRRQDLMRHIEQEDIEQQKAQRVQGAPGGTE